MTFRLTGMEINEENVGTWIKCEYIPPILEGFEKVLGRKFVFRDFDHFTKYDYPILSDETKAEIKLHDYELYPAGKVDTHPRFEIQWFDDETFDVIIMENLELIL